MHRQLVALGMLLLLVLAGCGGAEGTARAAVHDRPGEIRLATGTRVTLTAVQRARWPHSGTAFQVNYATSIPMTDTARLAAEARALWEVLRPDAERAGVCSALLQAQAPPTGVVVHLTEGYAFTFERDRGGGWRRAGDAGDAAPPPPCAD